MTDPLRLIPSLTKGECNTELPSEYLLSIGDSRQMSEAEGIVDKVVVIQFESMTRPVDESLHTQLPKLGTYKLIQSTFFLR